MLFIILLIKVTVLNAEININETTYKIKYILNIYKNYRHKRCTTLKSELSKMDNFAEKTFKILKKSQRYEEYFKYNNVSDCNSCASDNVCKKQHVVKSFLIHDKVPDSHWEEYKVGKVTYYYIDFYVFFAWLGR